MGRSPLGKTNGVEFQNFLKGCVLMPDGQVVVFELSGVRYGIDILHVQEIIRVVKITPVSETDFDLEGIINLRGRLIPVIRLSRRLGLTGQNNNEETRIIVVETKEKNVGLIVDRVLEVGKYTAEEMEKPSGIGSDTVSFLKGIIKKDDQLWLVLNLDNVA